MSTKKTKKKNKKVIKTILGTLFLVFTFCMCIGFTGGAIFLKHFVDETPELDVSKLDNTSSITYILDQDGNEIARLTGADKKVFVPYNEIPDQLIDAFIAIEDKRFWEHEGVDLINFSRATFEEVFRGGASRGGSTITQQLVKNIYLTSERSYIRKVKEFIMSFRLEDIVSKEKILEVYLNEIFMGEDNYGIKAASLDYFGKELEDLTLKESAVIAGMTSSPNYYDPRVNYEESMSRADLVLDEMLEQELISQSEYNRAIIEEPEISEKYFSNEVYAYPAFVDFVVNELAVDMLTAEKKEINEESIKQKEYEIKTGGYKIYTTLDYAKQDELQQIASNFNYKTKGVEMSFVAIDHHTGEIKIMIPGRSDNEVMDGFNRATDSLQPIGSTAKPIFVYAPYIELGANTDTIVDDTKTKIEGYKTDQGYPNGDTTDSKITLRYAIESSRNVAAVKTLAYQVGLDRAFEFQKAMGINPDHSSQSLNGIALGSDGLTTLECAGAYATLANDGVYIRPHGYTIVTDFKDNIVFKVDSVLDPTRVYSSETSWMITDILQTTVTNGLSVNSKIRGITSAGKTGTHENTSVTFGGYTGYYTGFVRISNDDYSPIYENSYTYSASLWSKLMTPLHQGLANRPIQDKKFEEVDIIKYGNEYRHQDGTYSQKVYVLEEPEEAEAGEESGE